ncbi:MAG: hypothetical protein FWC68_01385 [Oscillospiraceae bacterium]|nr:hypothetical protein [Oscillospiraceae bacterium]
MGKKVRLGSKLKRRSRRNRRRIMGVKGIISLLFIVVLLLYGAYLQNDPYFELFRRPGVDPNITIAAFEDIGIDRSKLNIFYFDVGQADSTLIMSARKNNAYRCRES